MKALLTARSTLLALLLAAPLLRGQATVEGQPGFPEKLLEGRNDFALALHFQSDARGNVGPCG